MKFSCALIIGLLLASVGTARAADDAPITQFKLQHTQCYGPCPIDELTLNADGAAQFAGDIHSARTGFYRGQIAPAVFAGLARVFQDQNFFELRAEIGDALTADAPDAIVSATRGGVSYKVVFRASGNRELLDKLEAAFAAASAPIGWQKVEIMGARGAITRDLTPYETRLFADRKPPLTAMPMRYARVTLTSMDDTDVVYATHSDGEGGFQIYAPPGRYLLSAGDGLHTFRPLETSAYLPQWLADGQLIEIKAEQFTPVELRLRDYNSDRKAR